MKKFNKVITVEVSVDTIAEQMLANLKDDFKHRELVTETIIGSAINKGGISFIYNALNGYTNEIDFAVGNVLHCSETYYANYSLDDNGAVVDKGNYVEIGNCRVVEIDIWKDKKLNVEFAVICKDKSKGFCAITRTTWVNHLTCNKTDGGVFLKKEDLELNINIQPSTMVAELPEPGLD